MLAAYDERMRGAAGFVAEEPETVPSAWPGTWPPRPCCRKGEPVILPARLIDSPPGVVSS